MLSNNFGPNSCRIPKELLGTRWPSRISSQFMDGVQGALVWWFVHVELDRSSVSQVLFNFLTTDCPLWVCVIIESLSQVPWQSVLGPLKKIFFSFWYSCIFQVGWTNWRKVSSFFFWNCDLSFWELLQTSFSNHKSLWRYVELWLCSWKKLIKRSDIPTYSFIQPHESLFSFAFSPLFTVLWITNVV